MNVLLVSSEFPPESPGGLGNAVRNLAIGLKELGVRPMVLSSISEPGESKLKMLEEKSEDGIKVFRIRRVRKRIKHEPGWFWRFHDYYLPLDCYLYSKDVADACRKIIRKEKVHIVQFPDYRGEGFSFIGSSPQVPCTIRLATPKYLVDKINQMLLPPGREVKGFNQMLSMKMMKLIENRPISRADAIASPSKSLAEIIKNKACPSGNIKIIHTGIDTDLFISQDIREVEDFRNSLRIADGPIVLFTGRYEHRKGIHHLIEAFKDVLIQYEKCNLVLAGGDTETAPGGGSMKHFIRKRVEELGIGEHVNLLDKLPHDKLPLLYSMADLFVAPSLYENLANTVLEALSCGLPVITTTSGGGSEVIEENVNGALVAPGNSKALANAIIELLGNRERCKIIGKKNAEKARRLFSRNKMAEGFLELYENLL